MQRAMFLFSLFFRAECAFQGGHRPPVFLGGRATIDGPGTRAAVDASLTDLLSESPFVINYVEVLDPSIGVVRSQPSGITITTSGYVGLFVVAVQQLFAPWGIIQYSKRLKQDEQDWLDLGKSPEQAITNAYQNVRPPKRPQNATMMQQQVEGGEKDES